jgi:hypothetical protein
MSIPIRNADRSHVIVGERTLLRDFLDVGGNAVFCNPLAQPSY